MVYKKTKYNKSRQRLPRLNVVFGWFCVAVLGAGAVYLIRDKKTKAILVKHFRIMVDKYGVIGTINRIRSWIFHRGTHVVLGDEDLSFENDIGGELKGLFDSFTRESPGTPNLGSAPSYRTPTRGRLQNLKSRSRPDAFGYNLSVSPTGTLLPDESVIEFTPADPFGYYYKGRPTPTSTSHASPMSSVGIEDSNLIVPLEHTVGPETPLVRRVPYGRRSLWDRATPPSVNLMALEPSPRSIGPFSSDDSPSAVELAPGVGVPSSPPSLSRQLVPYSPIVQSPPVTSIVPRVPVSDAFGTPQPENRLSLWLKRDRSFEIPSRNVARRVTVSPMTDRFVTVDPLNDSFDSLAPSVMTNPSGFDSVRSTPSSTEVLEALSAFSRNSGSL